MPRSAVSALRARATRFNRAMALVLVLAIGADVVLARATHIVGLGQLLHNLLGILFLLAAFLYCCLRPLPRLIDACEAVIWAVLFTNALTLFPAIAARGSRPLVDQSLARFDRYFHFSTAGVVRFSLHHPYFGDSFLLVYTSLELLIIVSLMAPALCGRPEASQRYIVGILIALGFTLLLFYRWPAIGPWTVEGFAPVGDQPGVAHFLRQLRQDGPIRLDPLHLGLISFPSFHAVLAVLSAIALGSVRRLKIPAWALAMLICISTVTTGWHYGADVLAGLGVALPSAWLARKCVSHLNSAPGPFPALAPEPAASPLEVGTDAP